MPRPLPRSFYARPVLQVAREMLGKLLVHHDQEGTTAGRIVEVEAYRGPEDQAAHSFGGRRTARTEVMFGPAGFAYLFVVYGKNWNFNVVTGKMGAPHAVLVRAIEPRVGIDLMATRRGLNESDRRLTNGPGKLCQAMNLNRDHYGLDLCGGEIALCEGLPPQHIASTPRIGIDYAEIWATKPWRFCDADSPYLSRKVSP